MHSSSFYYDDNDGQLLHYFRPSFSRCVYLFGPTFLVVQVRIRVTRKFQGSQVQEPGYSSHRDTPYKVAHGLRFSISHFIAFTLLRDDLQIGMMRIGIKMFFFFFLRDDLLLTTMMMKTCGKRRRKE